MTVLHAGFGEHGRAPRAHPHNLVQGLLHGALIAVPLWLVILRLFGLI